LHVPKRKFLSKYDEDFNLVEDALEWAGRRLVGDPKPFDRIRRDNQYRRFQGLSEAELRKEYPNRGVSSQVSYGKGVADHVVDPKRRKHSK